MAANLILPPAPKGDPILGHTRAFAKAPLAFMRNAAAEQGDIVRFQVLHKKVYMLNHPDYAKHVLQQQHKKYIKSPGYRPLRLLVGNGTFTSEGDFWLRQRRMCQPAFSKSSVEIYADAVQTCTQQAIESWQAYAKAKKPINICREMMKLTMEVIGRTLFSTGLGKDAQYVWEPLTIALDYINKRALRSPFVWPVKVPVSSNVRFQEAVSKLDAIIYGMIEQRKQDQDWPEDLLSTFLQYRDEETGEPMSMEQIRDECMTIFLAGHESSANVLSWAFYEIARNAEVQERMQAEIDATVSSSVPTYADLRSFEYLYQVMNETMRLYPPIWHLGRQNLVEDEIGGYIIPPKTHIRICPFLLHRHPDFWDAPNDFQPDRFNKENSKKQTPFSFIPFGMGPRLCIGRNFALMEMALILAMVLQRFRVHLAPGTEVELGPLLTLRPKEDFDLWISER